MPLPFHTPHPIWNAFGVKNFDDYLSKMVVSGRFHAGVPSVVRESYAVSEHLMAYAFYHPLLLNEALVKLLLTVELAVRMHDAALGLETPSETPPHRETLELLNHVVDLSVRKSREIEGPFHDLQYSLRNMAHFFKPLLPNTLPYSIPHAVQRSCIDSINALFMPNEYFKEAYLGKCHTMDLWDPWRFTLSVVRYGDAPPMALYDTDVEELFEYGGKWVHLVSLWPLPSLEEPEIFPDLLVLLLQDFKQGNESLHAVEVDSGKVCLWSKTVDPEFTRRYQVYITSSVDEDGEQQSPPISLYEKVRETQHAMRQRFWGAILGG